MHTIVTSFSQQGYHLYGKRFIDTFQKYWPKDIGLIVYHEGTILPDWCISHNLWYIKNSREFLQRYEKNKEVQGKKQRPGYHWKPTAIQEEYNFRYDAYRFCRKIFAIQDAAHKVVKGKLFWIDADTYTFQSIHSIILDKILPNKYHLSYLKRWAGYHSECGFVGYNLDHDNTRHFIDQFASIYSSDLFFDYKEWHDSFIFDRLRERLSIKGFVIPSTNMNNVFDTSLIGEYMQHLKGDRKNAIC